MLKDIKEIKDALKKQGMKVTPQRLAVFRALASTSKHPEAESIFVEVRKELPATSRATIYSALKSLTKAGFIREIGTYGGIKRFDGDAGAHSHLVCIGCSKIEDTDKIGLKSTKLLKPLLPKRISYKIINISLNFYGYCPDCKNRIKE